MKKIDFDGYYSRSDSEYIGSFPIRSDLKILNNDMPQSKGWKIEKIVSINGNKYIKLLNKYLKKVGKSSEDELTKEEIEKLYSKCESK